MAGYGSQYEEYYKKLKTKGEKRTTNRSFIRSYDTKNRSNYIGKRIIRDLTGTLLLFSVIITCKAIVTPETTAVYNYSKSVVDMNLDYRQLLCRLKTVNTEQVENQVTNFIEKVKKNVTGNKTVQEKTKEKFVCPVDGKIISQYGKRKDSVSGEEEFHRGIDIQVKEGTGIKSVYKGIVKDCGEDEVLGKYILIDHGEGLETKYAHLKEIRVKKGDDIDKAYIIGTSGNTGKSKVEHLHFELLYMGGSKDPRDFIAIK